LATHHSDKPVIILPPPDWMKDEARGAAVKGRNHNEAADRKHDRMETLLYGEQGHHQSEQHDEAVRRADKEKTAKAQQAEALGPKDPALGTAKTEAEPREFRDGLNERIRRYINDEKWDLRSEDPDLDPDRQPKAPGRGRTRSR
jgi:hypothetical protein